MRGLRLASALLLLSVGCASHQPHSVAVTKGAFKVSGVEARRGLWLFWRGFAIVGLTSANVALIAHRVPEAAFLTSAGISLLWWGNTQAVHAVDCQGARWWYGLGAGCGTVVAMSVTAWLT